MLSPNLVSLARDAKLNFVTHPTDAAGEMERVARTLDIKISYGRNSALTFETRISGFSISALGFRV